MSPKNLKADYFEYPKWLEYIVPYDSACGYIVKMGYGKNKHDILNTVLARFFRTKERGQTINKGYVFKSLRNAVRDIIRKDEREKQIKSNPDLAKTASQKQVNAKEFLKNNSDALDEILKQLGKLDVRSRVLIKLKLHGLYGFTFAELGNIVGYSESTARMEYNKVMALAKSKLAEYGVDIEV